MIEGVKVLLTDEEGEMLVLLLGDVEGEGERDPDMEGVDVAELKVERDIVSVTDGEKLESDDRVRGTEIEPVRLGDGDDNSEGACEADGVDVAEIQRVREEVGYEELAPLDETRTEGLRLAVAQMLVEGVRDEDTEWLPTLL